MGEIIDNSIQKISNIDEKEHVLLIDNVSIKNKEELMDLVNNFYCMDIFNVNTKVHLKLKINLREYLLISNLYYPTLIDIVANKK